MRYRKRVSSGFTLIHMVVTLLLGTLVGYVFLKLFATMTSATKHLEYRGDRESIRQLVLRNLSCVKTLNPSGATPIPIPPAVCDSNSDGIADSIPLRRENGEIFLNAGGLSGKWVVTAKCAAIPNSGASAYGQLRIAVTVPNAADPLTRQVLSDSHPQAALFSYGTGPTCPDLFGGNSPVSPGFTQMMVFDIPGTSTFQLPAGSLSFKTALIEVIGAGGGGGAGSYNDADCYSTNPSSNINWHFGMGGGGGGYASSYAQLDPTVIYDVVVGSGGAGGTGSSSGVLPTNGSTGGGGSFSKVSLNVAASGGGGGQTKCNNPLASGGAGGMGTAGALQLAGSEGGQSYLGYSISMGGSSARGGGGGAANCGHSGATGGGGAPGCNGVNGLGGAGGHGMVIVHW